MTNCNSCIENLYPYLDRELSPEEAREVEDHLRRCPPCEELFRFEAGVLRFVSECCKQDHAPERLKAKIRAMQQHELAEH